jgi:hypothetical protein
MDDDWGTEPRMAAVKVSLRDALTSTTSAMAGSIGSP